MEEEVEGEGEREVEVEGEGEGEQDFFIFQKSYHYDALLYSRISVLEKLFKTIFNEKHCAFLNPCDRVAVAAAAAACCCCCCCWS
jgi:hypothetical protein